MSVNIDLEFKDYYQEELYMVADVATGVLYNRSGRRMLALTDDFLIGLHRALEEECGDRANEVIYICGSRWGRNFGKGLTAEWSEFYGKPLREFPMALFENLLVQEFGHNGWGQLRVSYEHFPQGIIWLSLQGAIMASIRKGEEPNRQSDVLTSGILAGMFSQFFKRELECFQSQSEASGFADSRFLLSSKQRVESLTQRAGELKTHAETLSHLLELRDE